MFMYARLRILLIRPLRRSCSGRFHKKKKAFETQTIFLNNTLVFRFVTVFRVHDSF